MKRFFPLVLCLIMFLNCKPPSVPKEFVEHMKNGSRLSSKALELEGCFDDKRDICLQLVNEAKEEYLAAQKFSPRSSLPSTAVAGLYFYLGDLVQSRKFASQSYELDYDDGEAIKLLADISLLEQRNKEALSWLNKYIGMLNKDAPIQIGVDELFQLREKLQVDSGLKYNPVNNWQFDTPGWKIVTHNPQ